LPERIKSMCERGVGSLAFPSSRTSCRRLKLLSRPCLLTSVGAVCSRSRPMNLNELLITWLCLIDHLSPLVREDQRLCEHGCLLGRRCCRVPSGHTGYGSGGTAAIAGWHPRRCGCGWRRSLFRARQGVGGPVARRGQAADRCLRHYQGAAIHHDPPRSTAIHLVCGVGCPLLALPGLHLVFSTCWAKIRARKRAP
jgi:hypothetical protein